MLFKKHKVPSHLNTWNYHNAKLEFNINGDIADQNLTLRLRDLNFLQGKYSVKSFLACTIDGSIYRQESSKELTDRKYSIGFCVSMNAYFIHSVSWVYTKCITSSWWIRHSGLFLFRTRLELLGCGISQSLGCWLYMTTQTQKNLTHMPRVEFVPTIPASVKAKKVCASGRVATVQYLLTIKLYWKPVNWQLKCIAFSVRHPVTCDYINTGFGIITGFTEILQILTTNNYKHSR
jgi:hypothetical protein